MLSLKDCVSRHGLRLFVLNGEKNSQVVNSHLVGGIRMKGSFFSRYETQDNMK